MRKLTIAAVALVSVLGMSGDANAFGPKSFSKFCQVDCNKGACFNIKHAKQCADSCGGYKNKSIANCMDAAISAVLGALEKNNKLIAGKIGSNGVIPVQDQSLILETTKENGYLLEDMKAFVPFTAPNA